MRLVHLIEKLIKNFVRIINREICQEDETLNVKYDLLKNMGYGTKKHREGIENHGISEYHRKSFKPCCDYV